MSKIILENKILHIEIAPMDKYVTSYNKILPTDAISQTQTESH